jgi:hypothetical protein
MSAVSCDTTSDYRSEAAHTTVPQKTLPGGRISITLFVFSQLSGFAEIVRLWASYRRQ